MKKLFIILISIAITSCSVDESIEELQEFQQEATIVGTWIDTHEEPIHLLVSQNTITYEMQDGTDGPFDYSFDGEYLTVYHDDITTVKKVEFSNNNRTIDYFGKTYNRE